MHEYWKEHFADRFRSSGFVVDKEVERIGSAGRTDCLAERIHHGQLQQIAIEIETGKSHVVGNVLHNLRAGYYPVVVITTSPAAQARVIAQLSDAGLHALPQVVLIEAREATREFTTLLGELAMERSPHRTLSCAERNVVEDVPEEHHHRGPLP